MSKFTKVLVTVGIIFLYFILFAALMIGGGKTFGYKVPGFLGFLLLSAACEAIRATWKSGKNNKESDSDNDSSILQK